MIEDEFELPYLTPEAFRPRLGGLDERPRYLRTASAAKYLNMGVSTLEKMRMNGDGPPFFRITGRAVGYRVEDLDAWAAGRICHSTKEHLA